MRSRRPLDPTVAAILLALFAGLIASSWSVRMPGMPPTLKADEPAYFLGALSLAFDGDFRCEPKDLARGDAAFPFLRMQNLILGSDDGWQTVTYGKPWLYPAFAAPFARLAGAPGMVAFNFLLLGLCVWLGTDYLRRFNPDGLAALMAGGVFLGSHVWAYAFWLHPEILILSSVAVALHGGIGVDAKRTGRPLTWLVVSGFALAVATYHKPMLAAFALPIFGGLVADRRWKGLAIWVIAGLASMAAFAGGSIALTGHPTAYLGVERGGFNVADPEVMPTAALAEKSAAAAAEAGGESGLGKRSAGWWWIFRIPEVDLREFHEDVYHFLVGRHTGFLPYQPFAGLCLIAFLFGARGTGRRWGLLFAITLVAGFLLIFIPFNWHGGGGFVGNRYFVLAAPAFLYLVREIRPRILVPVTWCLAGLLIGPLWLRGYGVPVDRPTLQSHVRSAPFAILPFEHGLKEIPGYSSVVLDRVWYRARQDQVRFTGRTISVLGGDVVEVLLQSDEPVRSLVLEVTSLIEGNDVTLVIDGVEQKLRAGTGPLRVSWELEDDGHRRWDRDATKLNVVPLYVHRLRVETSFGEVPAWSDRPGPIFYEGARLRVLETSHGMSQSQTVAETTTRGARRSGLEAREGRSTREENPRHGTV